MTQGTGPVMKFLASERWSSLSLTLFDALVCYFPLFFSCRRRGRTLRVLRHVSGTQRGRAVDMICRTLCRHVRMASREKCVGEIVEIMTTRDLKIGNVLGPLVSEGSHRRSLSNNPRERREKRSS